MCGRSTIVLVAHVFHRLRARRPRDGVTGRPRLGVRTRIFDRHLIVQRHLIAPGKALDRMERFRVRMAVLIQPRPIVEADGVHDQRVAFPMSDRLSQVGRIGILRVTASIGKDRTPEMRSALEHEEHSVWQLKHLEGKRRLVHPRDARRQTPRFRIVFLQIRQALVVELLGPRLERNVDYLLDGCSLRRARPHTGNVLDHPSDSTSPCRCPDRACRRAAAASDLL